MILGVCFEQWEIKSFFCQIHWKIHVFRSQLIFINITGNSHEINFFASISHGKSETSCDFPVVPLVCEEYKQGEAHKIILAPVNWPTFTKMEVSLDKCLSFCQGLAMSNEKFNFSLSIGKDTFNFENKELEPSSENTEEVKKKTKQSPWNEDCQSESEVHPIWP